MGSPRMSTDTVPRTQGRSRHVREEMASLALPKLSFNKKGSKECGGEQLVVPGGLGVMRGEGRCGCEGQLEGRTGLYLDHIDTGAKRHRTRRTHCIHVSVLFST